MRQQPREAETTKGGRTVTYLLFFLTFLLSLQKLRVKVDMQAGAIVTMTSYLHWRELLLLRRFLSAAAVVAMSNRSSMMHQPQPTFMQPPAAVGVSTGYSKVDPRWKKRVVSFASSSSWNFRRCTGDTGSIPTVT